MALLPPPPRLEPGNILYNRYHIQHLLGSGGYGSVYKAVDTKRNRTVALKIASESLRTEYQLLSIAHHPSIPRPYSIEESIHFSLLVMEYIDGYTLEHYLRTSQRRPVFSLNTILFIAEELCDVLAFLHKRKYPLIICDLKPANIMMTHDGQVRLIDLGIARIDPHSPHIDSAFPMLRYTRGYAAPEYCAGEYVGPETDIYALGTVLHQLLTGSSPCKCSDTETRCTLRCFHFQSLHGPLGSTVMNMITHDVHKRIADADALRETFQSLRQTRATRFPFSRLYHDIVHSMLQNWFMFF